MTAQSRMGRQKEDTPIVNYQISGDCAAGELVHLVGCPGSGVLEQCTFVGWYIVIGYPGDNSSQRAFYPGNLAQIIP